MYLIALLMFPSLAAPQTGEEGALLAAVPSDAFALVHLVDPSALRSRAERNDWLTLFESSDDEEALLALEQEYAAATGAKLDGLFGLALELDGETLLFSTRAVAGFLTHPPADRTALASVLNGWLTDEPQRTLEVAGGRVKLGAWPEVAGSALDHTGKVLAFLDHPRALGLYSGDSEELVLAALTASLTGLVAGERRAPVVEQFLAAGGGTTQGIEAFVDFTPFVAEAERALSEAVEGVLPSPMGLLGLERGTWLFVTADMSPGTRVELRAQLRIPEMTLAADLADTFESLPLTLPPDLPLGTWLVYAFDWNLSRFYRKARAALELEDENGFLLVDQGIATAEAFSGVDPIEDFIDQLTGMFALYHVLDKDAEGPLEEEGFAFLAGLVDGDRFLTALEALLGVAGMTVDPTELEGAKVFLSDPDGSAGFDGGLSILPQRFLASPSRKTLARGIRALSRVDGAGLEWGSQLQAAFDENAGAFGFAFVELSNLRSLARLADWMPTEGARDPFLESRLIMAADRTAEGFAFRVYTR